MCNYSMSLTALAHIAVWLSRTANNHIWQSVKSDQRTLLTAFCVNYQGAGHGNNQCLLLAKRTILTSVKSWLFNPVFQHQARHPLKLPYCADSQTT